MLTPKPLYPVYLTSGLCLYKVQGKLWQDGTALFYIMRIPEFSLPGVSDLVHGNDMLVFDDGGV
ncbi:hypothetical protein ACWEQP_26910 [Streptomyces sp. NPDC004044]